MEAWVAKSMEVRVPEGWEESLQSEYIDTEVGSFEGFGLCWMID